MNTPRRKQRHVANLEVFATLSDERLAEMIRATETSSKQSQSALHALRMEQRRRRRAKGLQQA